MSKNTANKARKLLIFDMDGTLYQYQHDTYSKSNLKKKVITNAKIFIAKKLETTNANAEEILDKISLEYGEHLSVAFEKMFNIDRMEYFNNVWNINPKGLVKKNPKLRLLLLELITKGFELVIVSDAPKIWITNVLAHLNIADIFEGKIYSGETDTRKAFGNVFTGLMKKLNYNPRDCIIIGDQEETDIIPASESGALSIFIHKKNISEVANYSVKSIFELTKVLKL